ncbi:spermatogenesis associated 6-like protein isoform X3 [Cottoperca gobio]|uniref:Spermatogenesis associated 6-like protein isoform X3 n=1 Tax=Cottoperca gobio TaxID=56716 RepID=A0A6J2RN37_COTGO|nr:uncharacterized protein LOC115023675 isoform X3 [Cottoperca gobio]
MSRKALKVVVELKFRAVSCPGVHLPAKDDIYLSMWFMGQYCQSECLPAVFPLLFHEKITFEKIFRHIVDPGDIAVMLEYETVTIELVQLIPPVTETLACFEEDARRFLFPEPKLVPCSSGVDREVLMTRAPHFRGIAPRLEFSTKTTIIECSVDAEMNIYPNVLMASDKEEQETLQQTQELFSSGETTSNSWNETRWQDVHRKTQQRLVTFLHSQTPFPVPSKSWKHTEETLYSSRPSRLGHSPHLSAYAGFVAWSQSYCHSFCLFSVYQLLFTFDQVFIQRLEGCQKTTPALQKCMTPLTNTKFLTLQGCGGLIGNRPGTAGLSPALTENGKRSKSVFGDSLQHQKLYADLSMGPHTAR